MRIRRTRDGSRAARTALAALMLGFAPPALAEAEEGAAEAVKGAAVAEEGAATPVVSRDALFKLPPTTKAPRVPREVGGATRQEWQERFRGSRAGVAEAMQGLADAQAELEELAAGTDAWQVSAPGAPVGAGENGPLSFGLRQQIRESREEVKTAERAFDELRIEANLAGVPSEWMGTSPDGPPGAAEAR